MRIIKRCTGCNSKAVRKFLSLRECRHFCERNNLTVKATGVKVQTQRDIYKKALLDCGECLF